MPITIKYKKNTFIYFISIETRMSFSSVNRTDITTFIDISVVSRILNNNDISNYYYVTDSTTKYDDDYGCRIRVTRNISKKYHHRLNFRSV